MFTMKLPKWMVVAMLGSNLLLVLGFGSWWWVTWPVRTMREVFAIVDEGDFVRMRALVVGATWGEPEDGAPSLKVRITTMNGTVSDGSLVANWYYFQSSLAREAVRAEPRTFGDIVHCRQRLKAPFGPHTVMEFSAVRDHIVLERLGDFPILLDN